MTRRELLYGAAAAVAPATEFAVAAMQAPPGAEFDGYDWRTTEYRSPHNAYYIWALPVLEKNA